MASVTSVTGLLEGPLKNIRLSLGGADTELPLGAGALLLSSVWVHKVPVAVTQGQCRMGELLRSQHAEGWGSGVVRSPSFLCGCLQPPFC